MQNPAVPPAIRQRFPLRVAEIAQCRASDADIVVIGEEPRPLIPPGIYDAAGVDYQRAWVGRAPKLVVLFDVIVPGSDSTVRLGRFYNMERLRDGRLRAPRHGDYAREWTLVANMRLSRHERPNPASFVRVLVSVEVATVTQDRQQRPLPPHAYYSKVGRILELKAGGYRV
jgi:hypothetical protein